MRSAFCFYNDMFWADDEQAVKNSVCRAISGGPVYVSDKIGRTRPEILKPLCLCDGRILRPDHSAIPTKDSCLGLLDKYVGIAAVREAKDNIVTLAEGGKVGFCPMNRSPQMPFAVFAPYLSALKTLDLMK